MHPRNIGTLHLSLISCLALVAGSSGCGHPPKERIEALRAALQSGETTVLSVDDSENANHVLAQRIQVTAPATIDSLSFYVQSPAGKLRMGVYDASGPLGGPGAKKAETAEITTVSGWNTASVLAPVVLPPGRYWLAHLPSDDNLHYRKTGASVPGNCVQFSYAYGPLPATFATTTSSCSDHWSFYATLAGATPTNIGQPTVLGGDDADNGNLLLGQKTTLAQPQVIQSISFYAPQADGVMRLGIYDASGPGGDPGAKKAWTAEVTAVQGWNTVPIDAPTLLPAGDYWLVILPSSSALHFAKAASGGSHVWKTFSYGLLPDTFTTTAIPASNRTGSLWSFYATLTPPSAGTVDVTVKTGGYLGQICIADVCKTGPLCWYAGDPAACRAQAAITFTVPVGNQNVLAVWSAPLTGPVNWELVPGTRPLVANSDGTLSMSDALKTFFDQAGTTLTLKTRLVTVNMNGHFGGQLGVSSSYENILGPGSTAITLLAGRRHALGTTWAKGLDPTNNEYLSSATWGLTVNPIDPQLPPLVLDAETQRTFAYDGDTTLTGRTAEITVDYRGSPVDLGARGVNSGGTFKFLAGRRYQMVSGNGSWPLDRDEPPGTSGAALSFEGDGFGFKVIDEHTIEADDSTKVHLDISGTHLKVKVAQVKIEFPGSNNQEFCLSWIGCSGGNASMTQTLMVDRRYEVQGAGKFKVLANGTCDGNGVTLGGHPIQLTCNLVSDIVQVNVQRLVGAVPIAVPGAQVDVYQGLNIVSTVMADANGVATVMLPNSGPVRFHTEWWDSQWWSSAADDCTRTSCPNKTITVSGVEVSVVGGSNQPASPWISVGAYTGGAPWLTFGGVGLTDAAGIARVGVPAGATYRFRADDSGRAYWSTIDCAVAACTTATIVMDPAVPPAVPPPGEAIIAMVDNPIGRMASDNEISRISDGIMVAAGESSPAFQYDTYTNDPDRTEDWIGYQYSETRSFSALTFQEGLHFSDGGWFETLSVQVRQGGTWVPVSNLQVGPNYPGNNGIGYETFSLAFDPIDGDGIRLYGRPGGAKRFISVGELHVPPATTGPGVVLTKVRVVDQDGVGVPGVVVTVGGNPTLPPGDSDPLLPPIPTPPPQQAVSDKDGIALLVLPVANPVVLRPTWQGVGFPTKTCLTGGCSPLSVWAARISVTETRGQSLTPPPELTLTTQTGTVVPLPPWVPDVSSGDRVMYLRYPVPSGTSTRVLTWAGRDFSPTPGSWTITRQATVETIDVHVARLRVRVETSKWEPLPGITVTASDVFSNGTGVVGSGTTDEQGEASIVVPGDNILEFFALLAKIFDEKRWCPPGACTGSRIVVDAPHPDACVLKDWENSGDVAFRHTWALAGGACDEARATALMQKWGLNIEGNSIYPTSITASEFIGKNNPCDLRLPVGRAINALEFLKFFQEPGRLDAQPTWPDGAVFPGVPMNIVGQGYQYIDNVADDGEMEVSCDGDDVAWSGGFGGIKLRRPFFEDTPVYWRAAVLVHEARHSDGTVIFPVWDHVPCLQAPAQGNDCDQEFTLSGGGPYSFEVRYLWEWATRCGDHCTQQQRWDALTAAQDLLDKRFVTRPTIGITRPPPPPPGP